MGIVSAETLSLGSGRLPQFQLPDVTVLLEAFENPRFRRRSVVSDCRQ